MKSIHTKSKESKSISLLIVPHSKDIKQLKFASWIPKFILSLVILVICTSGYLTWNLYESYNQLKENYGEKTTRLEKLEQINLQQKDEINSLRTKTAEVEEKLKSISSLQETVKNMVGLTDSKDSSKSITNTSRGGGLVSRSDYSLAENDDHFEAQMSELSKMLDQSSDDLNSLITDVEKKLKYLESKPNLMPTSGKITSPYGYRKNPFGRGREFHTGIDIANNSSTKIKAAGKGVVTFAGYNSGYGKMIVISHGYGYQSVYGHNRELLVKVGDKVEKGQLISEMGNTGRSTGPHLHFEVRLYGKTVNPKNVINNYD